MFILEYAVAMDEFDIYDMCKCDRTRRHVTSVDGYNMHCDKCIICGVSGHHRSMPGAPRSFKAGWCEYHYQKIENTSTKQMRNVFSTARQDSRHAAHLICGNDMGVEYYERQADNFFAEKKPSAFNSDLGFYLADPSIENITNFMQHFPESMPYEWIVDLTECYREEKRREEQS